MGNINQELDEKIQSLPETEKLDLVDSILMQLDRPDPEMDKIWSRRGNDGGPISPETWKPYHTKRSWAGTKQNENKNLQAGSTGN